MAKSLNSIIEHHRQERDLALERGMIPRQMTPDLKNALSSKLVKVITGPRRAGKSTLAFQALSKKRFAYLNFEDDLLRGEISSDELVDALVRVYGKPEFFFFDEIQNHANWESFINKLHRRGFNLVLTGSNSRLLSRELGSALTGRHIAFELLPFSFTEFLTATGLDAAGWEGKSVAERLVSFQQYLVWGGFPEVVLEHSNRLNYLRSLFDSVVLRDIVARHRIRQSTEIHDLLTLLMNSAANRFSARGLERSLGSLSTATIQKYLSYSREAYLVQDLQPYFFKTRMRIKADRKIYAYDNGFITAMSQPATSNTSRLLENLVFVDLARRGFKPNMDLFYYQTRSGHEVDFLIRQSGKNHELIQVTQNLSSLKTKEREIRSLLSAARELDATNLTIVTLDTEDTIQANGFEIHAVPCWRWMQRK